MKNGDFDSNNCCLSEKLIVALEKGAFFAEIWLESPKIVIIKLAHWERCYEF
jgi:hypothetical protein